ncbi:ankyrin repeat domain-containing protein [Aquisphaera insulae]|uniref:ankyrin repeat domain-containing protein n=1 Tax=Aquisphaera insulae TaxID=2712864 RepID=UPI0013ED4A98|nr:ankyrin repeat domain-containing protein [Aquisphaera insulae]
MAFLPAPRRWRTLRIRTLLVLVAVIAVGIAAPLELARRERWLEWVSGELLHAAEAGDVPRIRSLLDEGAPIECELRNRDPFTPLMLASWRGKAEAVRLLLERGADPDHENVERERAITMAAIENHWDIFRMLVEYGADLTACDATGRTGLDYARLGAPPELLQWLEARMLHPR